MTKELDPIEAAAARQAEIVAAQEEAQSIPPTPTQKEIDAARLGMGVVSDEPAESDAEVVTKDEQADKPGTYKTRASKAD